MTPWLFRLAVAGALAMLASIPFLGVAAAPCNPLPMSPMIAFELVRTVEDIQFLLGLPGDACRMALAQQLDHANLVDTFAYIPAYVAFFAFAALGLGARSRMLGRGTALLAVICGVADVAENMGMLALSATPEDPGLWLTVLIVATNVKWVGLGVVTTLCGLMLARRGGMWRFLAPICAAPLAIAIWAVAAPQAAGPYLLSGMTIASLPILTACIAGALRRSHGADASVAA